MIHVFINFCKFTVIQIQRTGVIAALPQCFCNHCQIFSGSMIRIFLLFHLLIEEEITFAILFYIIQCLISLGVALLKRCSLCRFTNSGRNRSMANLHILRFPFLKFLQDTADNF